MPKRSNKRVKATGRRPRTMTPEEREDARDLALIRRELAKGGKTYSFAQVMRELGFDDLARKAH